MEQLFHYTLSKITWNITPVVLRIFQLNFMLFGRFLLGITSNRKADRKHK